MLEQEVQPELLFFIPIPCLEQQIGFTLAQGFVKESSVHQLHPNVAKKESVKSGPNHALRIVIPAKAGIQGWRGAYWAVSRTTPRLDSRFRGNDDA